MNNRNAEIEDEQRRHTFGELLKNVREEKHRIGHDFSQRRIAERIGYCLDNRKGTGQYGYIEAGKKWITREKLLVWRDEVSPSLEDWEKIRELYIPKISEVSDKQNLLAYFVLDKDRDGVNRPDCFSQFSSQDMSFTPSRSPSDMRRWCADIFRFGNEKVPIIYGVEDVHSPRLDLRAAKSMKYILKKTGISSKDKDYIQDELQDIDRDLILSGGPGNNQLSGKINEIFSKSSWFNGFFFSKRSSRVNDWEILHKNLPEFKIESAQCYDITSAREYLIFDDNGSQDYGLIYVGPNPVNTKKWLIIVAGLGRAGTFGAAKIFSDERFVECLHRCISGIHDYFSVAVRYRFYGLDDPSIESGYVSSMLLTRGQAV